MVNSHLALSSALHEKNLCTGLSSLQQNGEFVDMTIAADGHHVKVHQVVLAVASPYIKDLISSTQCQHPVIFLNNISYATLSAILEYIYTGEVLVAADNLKELINAGKELHIKGLEDMELQSNLYPKEDISKGDEDDMANSIYLDILNNRDHEEITEENKHEITYRSNEETELQEDCQETFLDEAMDDEEQNEISIKTEDPISQHVNETLQLVGVSNVKVENATQKDKVAGAGTLQYTVSNQGSLQMILNRFVYYLKYTNRNRTRQWRCTDYLKSVRCPAHVVTKDDVVIKRIAAHTHPFHDQRILKKLRSGAIFSAIVEAEKTGENILKKRNNTEADLPSDD